GLALGVADILRVMADHAAYALFAQPRDIRAIRCVRALHRIAQLVQQLRHGRHADAADADKMKRAEFFRKDAHYFPIPFITRSASRSAASGRPKDRDAAAAATSAAGSCMNSTNLADRAAGVKSFSAMTQAAFFSCICLAFCA